MSRDAHSMGARRDKERPGAGGMDSPSVSGSLRKTSRQSIKSVPLKGSPPMPVVCGRSGARPPTGGLFGSALARQSTEGSKAGAARTDAEGLAEADGGRLADGLVGQGAGARDDANVAGAVDVAGHDANLALVGLDDAGAVGAWGWEVGIEGVRATKKEATATARTA